MSERRSSGDVDHEAIISSIAQEMRYPIRIVKRIYEEEFARLRSRAGARDHLALFASRRTRSLLHAARRQRSTAAG